DVSQRLATGSKAVVAASLCDDCLSVRAGSNQLFIGAGSGGLRTGSLDKLTGLGRGYPGTQLDFEEVVVDGHYAYAADWFFGLRIFDVSDPAAPKVVGALGLGPVGAIVVVDGRAYLGQS